MTSSTTKRVVICGGGPSKCDVEAMMTPDSQLWVVGVACPEYHEEADAVFEMHQYDNFKKLAQYKYSNDLKTCPGRVIMLQGNKAVWPTSESYPIEEMVKLYGRYFTSTISYMIALALYEGFKEIVLVGVELDKEIYRAQRMNIEFFIGIAWGSGVTVTFPDTLPFLSSEGLYGYEV